MDSQTCEQLLYQYNSYYISYYIFYLNENFSDVSSFNSALENK